ncbi:MAG: electron transport complex subunit RsxC [Clostridia bacterium]|nr:electron transport complex subunit RsxC [Clostridia bacterium]
MKNTFRGGVHPLHRQREGKPLASGAPVRAVLPERVVIPMGMHLGAPSEPCVAPGEHVLAGQRIAEPVGGLGLPVHASISGEVRFVDKRQQLRAAPELCIGIESDGRDEWAALEPLGGAEDAPADKIIEAVKQAGVCGMGGASFPTHIKMMVPEGKTADTVILNGAECEPYLCADHRLMLETPERVVDGLRLILRATGVRRGVVAIEANKPDALESMRRAAAGREGIEVMPLKTKYPQGSEKQLIHVVTGRQVPRGKLPVDAHALVFNVSTAAAIADAVIRGKPLVERVTTVTGCVAQPSNLLLRVGTTYAEALAACGGLRPEARKLFAGGPMTGLCAPDESVSMTKATNGIVAFDERQSREIAESPCIRCARCVDACPIGLMPYLLRHDCEHGGLDAAKTHGLLDCVLCGACAYICPARRHLTASFKAAREELAARGRK